VEPRYRFYRRRLPHWREEGATYFVTWRLTRGVSEPLPQERTLVAKAILQGDGIFYELDAFVIMNDHVHVLVYPLDGRTLESIVRFWKSFSARQILAARRGTSQLWQREYFDRIIDNSYEFRQKSEYIRRNPWTRWPRLTEYEWVWPKEYF